MRLRRLVASLGMTTLAVAAACSSFSGADGPVDGGGGTEDGAMLEVGTLDATPGAEAGDAGVGGFIACSQRAVDPLAFCDDFDHAERIDFAWSARRITGDAMMAESFNALSAPRAMAVRIPETVSSSAHLERSFVADMTGKTKMSLSFALRWDADPYAAGAGKGYMIVGGIHFDDSTCGSPGPATERAMQLVFSPSGRLGLGLKSFQAECVDGGDFVGKDTPIQIGDFKTFKRLRLVVSKSSCPGTSGAVASATVEGDGLPGPTCQPLMTDPFAYTKAMHFTVGLVGGGGAHQAAELSVDDVTFEVE